MGKKRNQHSRIQIPKQDITLVSAAMELDGEMYVVESVESRNMWEKFVEDQIGKQERRMADRRWLEVWVCMTVVEAAYVHQSPLTK